jgi:hypothetical protein
MPLYSDCETFPDLTATLNHFAKVEILNRVAFWFGIPDAGLRQHQSMRI